MSVRPTTARGSADRDDRICAAPSCWDKGSRVEIDGDDVETAPVLCEVHRKCYLGVSS
jgi:hypothetical protein